MGLEVSASNVSSAALLSGTSVLELGTKSDPEGFICNAVGCLLEVRECVNALL